MADLAAGEVFVDGQSGTAARLNNHVNGATILPGFMARLAASTPVVGDYVHWGKADGTAHGKVTITNLFSLLAVDAAVGVGSLRTIGTGAQQAAPGDFLTDSNIFTGTKQSFRHIGVNGPIASIAAGAALGGGTAVLGSGSSDMAGFITLTPGAGTTTGTTAIVTFGTNYSAGPWVFLVPFNANALAAQGSTKGINVSASAAGSFTIQSGNTALTNGTVYQYVYFCVL